MFMRNINKHIRTLIVIIALCSPFIASPTQGQANDTPATDDQVMQKKDLEKDVKNRYNDNWKQPFADAVKMHKVVTDVAVSVFDLFDISSFSMESSYPQTPFSIPVLGRLPIIGPVFQCPRDKKRVHHESIILVNTIILPRAMDLARFYGGN
jgi:hypothetical protein